MELTVKKLTCSQNSKHEGVKRQFRCIICGFPVELNMRGYYTCSGTDITPHTKLTSNQVSNRLVCSECGSELKERTVVELASGNPRSKAYQTWLEERHKYFKEEKECN